MDPVIKFCDTCRPGFHRYTRSLNVYVLNGVVTSACTHPFSIASGATFLIVADVWPTGVTEILPEEVQTTEYPTDGSVLN